MPPRRKAPPVAAALATLDEALDNRKVIPACDGLPEIWLEAPTNREAMPTAKEFVVESQKDGNFFKAVDEAAIQCLMLTVRYPDDPDRRITRRRAELLAERHNDEPTERSAWRSALKLCRIVDMDEVDELVKQTAKRPKRRRKAEETEAPKDDSPTK